MLSRARAATAQQKFHVWLGVMCAMTTRELTDPRTLLEGANEPCRTLPAII